MVVEHGGRSTITQKVQMFCFVNKLDKSCSENKNKILKTVFKISKVNGYFIALNNIKNVYSRLV